MDERATCTSLGFLIRQRGSKGSRGLKAYLELALLIEYTA